MRPLFMAIVSIALLPVLSFKNPVPLYGTREGTLTGKSETGRTLFNAKLENGTGLESAEFIIDNAKSSFTLSDNCYAIFDPAAKVYTIWLEEKTEKASPRFIQFWADPATFKLVSSDGKQSLPHEVYTFKAKIYGREPRTGFDYNSKTIELNCTLDLE